MSGADPAPPEAPALTALAERLSDGLAVDWDSAAARAGNPDVKRLVDALRLVERVAAAHAREAEEITPSRPLVRPELRQWAHLEVLEKVGEGGFAEVFRARDPLLDREVALKLLLPRRTRDMADQDAILREGRLLARIKHPNVATVYGAERKAGRIGIWMEYISGDTLARLARRDGPFAASEAMLIGLRLCDALATLHAGGLVHRDVKAQNVMREKGGRIVLMDFGVARELAEITDREGSILGTPLYMAPELLRGEPATARSDLFSVGVLLYHLVTGDFPWHGPGARGLLEARRSGVERLLRDHRPGLADEFYEIVDRALTHSPEDRFGSAGEMSRALRFALGRSSDPTGSGDGLAPTDAGAPIGGTPGTAGHRRRLWLGGSAWPRPWLVAAAVVAAVLAVLAQRSQGPPPGIPSRISRLAITPFVNVSGDETEDYLASAVPIELIARLGQVDELKVVPWSFTRRYLDVPRSLEEIATATGADAVVEGSVHLRPGSAPGDDAGSRVRITIQVFQARTGALLWSLAADGGLGEFLAMQDRIAQQLATGLHARIARRDRLVATTAAAAPEAMERYLRGGEALEARTPDQLAVALEHFRAAGRLDPSFVEAQVALAEAVTLLSLFTGAPSSTEALETALAATGRALDLDPSNGRGWAARAFAHYVFAWDWATAGAEFRRALELSPHAPLAHHWYSDYLSAQGHHAAALRHARIAAERSPASPIMRRDVAWVLFFARRYEDAIAELGATLRLEPGFPPARTLLARAFVMLGRHDEALRELQQVEGYGLLRAQALAAAGKADEARALLRELESVPGGELRSPYMRAQVLAALGEIEAAFAALAAAVAERDPAVVSLMTDPMLDALRGAARFDELLESAGFSSRERF